MVVLSFQVTDSKNRYINGLKPSDFRIYEDGILQKVSTFAEGAKAPVAIADDGSTHPLLEAKKDALPGMEKPDAFVGTNVFVLFDTSNFMYRGFVYAEDAIADFVRGLDRADSVAVYTFSRNLSRAASLTRDHSDAISGLRKSVAGDDTALYNALPQRYGSVVSQSQASALLIDPFRRLGWDGSRGGSGRGTSCRGRWRSRPRSCGNRRWDSPAGSR